MRRRFLFLSLFLAITAALHAQTLKTATLSVVPGRYSQDIVLTAAALDENAVVEFSWSREGNPEFFLLDIPLALSAFPNEERIYDLRLRVSLDGKIVEEGLVRYIIDRQSPLPPIVRPEPGSYRGELIVRFEMPDDVSVMYRIVAADFPVGDFVPYTPGAPPSLVAPDNGVRRYTVVAYSVDSVGNAGQPVGSTYFVASKSIPVAETTPSSLESRAVISKGVLDGVQHKVYDLRSGVARIDFSLPTGSRFMVAVNPTSPFESIREYYEIAVVDSLAHVELSVPYCWTDTLRVYYALMTADGALVANDPVAVKFAFPESLQRPLPPSVPQSSPMPEGGALVISWPPSADRIMYSVDGAPFAEYSSPVFVSARKGLNSIEIAYYAENFRGKKSDRRMATIVVPRFAKAPLLLGIPTFPVNKEVRISSDGSSVVRYELTRDGTMPVPIDTSSPILPRELAVDGEAGKQVNFVLRVRAFPDGSEHAEGSDENLYSFIIDHDPPLAPTIVDPLLDNYSTKERSIRLEASDATIFVSVAEEGQSDYTYEPYGGPLTLSGSDDRRVCYIVRSYAVDESGNHSPDMAPYSVLIDRGSVYAASWGSDAGNGSPVSPYRSLEAAVAMAIASGRRQICVNGSISLSSHIRMPDRFEISGKFDEKWNATATASGSIRIASGNAGISASGTKFVMRGIAFLAESVLPPVLFDFNDTDVELSAIACVKAGPAASALSSPAFTFVHAVDSTISADDVSLDSGNVSFGVGFDMERGELRVRLSRFRADVNTRFYTAISARYAYVSVLESKFEARSSSNFTGVLAAETIVELERSLFEASGGTGVYAALQAEGGKINVGSCMMNIDWVGNSALFTVNNGSLTLSHITVVIERSGKRCTVLDLGNGTSYRIVNSIFGSRAGLGVFMSRRMMLDGGSVSSNCFSGSFVFREGDAGTIGLEAFGGKPGSYHNFSEDFNKTFGPLIKGFPTLGKGSVCINAANLLESRGMDFFGNPWPSGLADGKPDLGAIEYPE